MEPSSTPPPRGPLPRIHAIILIVLILATVLFIYFQDKRLPSRRGAIILLAILIVAFLLVCLYEIPRWQLRPYSADVAGKEKGELENEFRKTLAQIIGGSVLLLGLYFTALEVRASQERQTTERYHWAVTQLGSDEPVARLGGIYTLARIARESEADQRAVVKILTSFIRFHRQLPSPNDTTQIKFIGCRRHREPIPFDVQAAIDVLQDRQSFLNSEGGDTLDLSRADLRNANLSRMDLRKANLRESLLEGAQLVSANLTRADLSAARLDRADLSDAHLDWAQLNEAALCATILTGAVLHNTVLTDADFSEAQVTDAVLREASTRNTNFERTIDLTETQLRTALLTPTTRLPERFLGLRPTEGADSSAAAVAERCGCLTSPTAIDSAAPQVSRTIP